MLTMTVGELKTHFSEILEQVRKGGKVVISYGKKRKNVAVLVPYDEYIPRKERKLGILKGRAKFVIRKGFKVTDREMLSS